ncbi:hypothetical protein DBB29_01085 [Pandoraea cepalis]|uniref:NIPSNAP domain-containing protein n=1 Tax=Pandoraea cepalis TaxID=2508294 RepID=A0AAW7MH36_9BURK|nr:NIPSNAP family protein [Pandoraea cepalis]MDN4572068.1 hypothetical protein [Pandoraea cepalis]MDN4576724.1 hypothetical protein [Pandoraea cepalis]
METLDESFVELRLYHVASGRMPDMRARLQEDLCRVFPRHGIVPAATWDVLAGPNTPLLAYVTPWPDMATRTRAWAGFYADPDWAEIRARTNAGSELVERFDILFLRAIVPWHLPENGVRPALTEMVVQSTTVGLSGAVRDEITHGLAPEVKGAGAHLYGAFDVTSGYTSPSAVYFIGWNDSEQRVAAQAAIDTRIRTRRHAHQPALLERADRYLMSEIKVDRA